MVVMVTMPGEVDWVTKLPGSTRRRPTRPATEVELRDARLVRLDCSFTLLDQEFLIDEGLFGYRFLLVQLSEADEIGAGLTEARLVLRQLRLGLLLADLELARIDLRQELTLLYILAFMVAHRRQITAQLRQDIDRRGRRNRAQFVQGLRHFSQGRGSSAHHLRCRRGLRFLAGYQVNDDEDEQYAGDDPYDEPAAPFTRL
jgi:hypothetical protein